MSWEVSSWGFVFPVSPEAALPLYPSLPSCLMEIWVRSDQSNHHMSPRDRVPQRWDIKQLAGGSAGLHRGPAGKSAKAELEGHACSKNKDLRQL